MTRSIVFAVAIATTTLVAQQKPPAAFRSSVTLVAVDVTVLDKDGRPVPGLAADDFQIKLNGKVQPIRTVEYVEAVARPGAANAAGASVDVTSRRAVTNAIPAKDPKIFVLAIDDLSFPPEGARRTLTAAREFIFRQAPGVLVGLTTTSGSIAVNPTLDRNAAADALKHVVGEFIDPRKSHSPESPAVGIAEAIEIAEHNNTSLVKTVTTRECLDGGQNNGEGGLYSPAIGAYNSKCATDILTASRLIATLMQGMADRQISALTNTLAAMKGAPGLKQMIVLSQGVPGTRDLFSMFAPVTKAASAAGVQLSVLMEDDDEVDMSQQNRGASGIGQLITGTATTSARREDKKMFLAALATMADATGGTFERVISSPDGAFQRAALAGSAVYRLGVEAPSDVSASKAMDVSASATRRELTVRANRHAVLPSATVPDSSADKVAAAIKHGRLFYAVPLRVAVARRAAAGNQVELGVGISVPAAVTGPLHLTIGVMDAAGGLKQGTRVIPADGRGDYGLTVPMPVAPGKYRVRLAVEDAAGDVGSVETQVDAELMTMGDLTSSDLLTWWKDASGKPRFLALDEVPAGVTNLNAGLELYKPAGAAVPADLKCRLALWAAGAGAPIAEIDLIPQQEGDVLRVESSLPLANLAAGSYVIRATVSAGGQRLGEVSAAITKR